MSTAELTTSPVIVTERETPARVACLVAGLGAAVPFALCSFTGSSGAEITAGLEADVARLTIGSVVALVVSAVLVLAAVRLGARVRGTTGVVLTGAGIAVAMLYAAFYAVFGAGAVVANQSLDNPGAGLGEAASLMLNVVEITRYAPGRVLVAAAGAARRVLPRPVWIPAAGLVALTLFPMTSWVGALLIPPWLGASAAGLGQNSRSVGSSIPRSAS